MKLTKILTIVFVLAAVGIGYYLVNSIKFKLDEEERIARIESVIIDKLMLIRDAEVGFKAANGRYTSDWNKLISFIDTGKFYLTERREKIITLDYGADSVSIEIDTLGSVPVRDSLFSNPAYSKFQLEDLSFVPPGKEKKFVLQADKIKKGNVDVDVFMAEDPTPINPARKGKNPIKGPLRVGSMTEVTIAGNWE